MKQERLPGNQQVIVLYPNKRKLTWSLLVSLVFVAFGLFADVDMIRWPAIIFFGLGAIVFIVQLLPGASYLRLTHEGFIFCSLFRKSRFILWREVSDFRVAAVPPSRMKLVVFDLSGTRRGLRRMNRALVGASDGLPDTYGMKPEELAELLNAWRSLAIAIG